jgi:hypothetical protein
MTGDLMTFNIFDGRHVLKALITGLIAPWSERTACYITGSDFPLDDGNILTDIRIWHRYSRQ